jgi:hypothetical protein
MRLSEPTVIGLRFTTAKYVRLRGDFVAICEGKVAPALVLGALESWTETKGAGEWVFWKQADITRDTFAQYSADTVTRAITYLLKRDFIARRRNPHHGWDRTYQYRLNIEAVNDAMTTSPQNVDVQSPLDADKEAAGSRRADRNKRLSMAADNGHRTRQKPRSNTQDSSHDSRRNSFPDSIQDSAGAQESTNDDPMRSKAKRDSQMPFPSPGDMEVITKKDAVSREEEAIYARLDEMAKRAIAPTE